MALVLDIETIPLDGSLLAAYPAADRQPPANYKSDEAIAKWRLADEQKWRDGLVKEASLNPRLGRIACVATADTEDWRGTLNGVLAPTCGDEAELLKGLWAQVDRAHGNVVTWNGAFDLRFLLIRSMAHDIRPSIGGVLIQQWFRKYTFTPHFDCKAALLNWETRVAGEGLDEWAAFFGVAGKNGHTGADVWPMWQEERFADIRTYCMGDVAATAQIHRRLASYFL